MTTMMMDAPAETPPAETTPPEEQTPVEQAGAEEQAETSPPEPEKVGSAGHGDLEKHLHQIEEHEREVFNLKSNWEAAKEEAAAAKKAYDVAVDRLCAIIRRNSAADAPLFTELNKTAAPGRVRLQWTSRQVKNSEGEIEGEVWEAENTVGITCPWRDESQPLSRFIIEQAGPEFENFTDEQLDDESCLAFKSLETAQAWCQHRDDELYAALQVPPSDAWRAESIDVLNLKPRIAGVLKDREPPLATLGALADYQQAKGDFWAQDLKGLGPKGREELENAQMRYWQEHPLPKDEKAQATPADEAPFDDQAIQPDSDDTILEIPGLMKITVCQRVGGRWAYTCSAKFGRQELSIPLIGTSYPSRVHAIAAASDRITDFVRDNLGKKTPPKAKRQAEEINIALNTLDAHLAKSINVDGIADDVKEFWSDRQKALDLQKQEAAEESGGKSKRK